MGRRLDCKAEEVQIQTGQTFVQTVRTKRRQGGYIDMATAEKFCLRWNDFESNISVAFRELREEKDFFDVTLAVAEELRVKGLTQNSSESSKQRDPPQRNDIQPSKRMRPAPPPATSRPIYREQEVVREVVREDEVQEVETVPVKAEPREQVPSYQESQESAVALEDGYQEEQYEEYGQYEEGYDGIDPNTGMPMADGNKGQEQDRLFKCLDQIIQSKCVKR